MNRVEYDADLHDGCPECAKKVAQDMISSGVRVSMPPTLASSARVRLSEQEVMIGQLEEMIEGERSQKEPNYDRLGKLKFALDLIKIGVIGTPNLSR